MTLLNGVDQKNTKYIELTLHFIKESLKLAKEKDDYLIKCEILQIITVMLETLADKINNYFELILTILLQEFLDNDKLSYKLVVIQNVRTST